MTSGAVLAGGASRRMGRDKSLVEIGGVPMVRRVASALASGGCDPVVVIGGDRAALASLALTVIDDGWPGEGPLGGIITALQHTVAPTLVVACDVPWIDAETVEGLRSVPDGFDVTVATSSRIEPLCACWAPSALTILQQCFDEGVRAVHLALERLRVHPVAVDPAALRNVNAPDDLPPL